MRTKKLLIAVLACVALAAPMRADDVNIKLPGELVIKSVTLIATGTFTSQAVDLGKSRDHGLDWDLTSDGTPSLHVELLQCNSATGTFTKWSNPSVSGYAVNNDFTTTQDRDGTGITVSPSLFIKVKITNTDAATVTVNRMTMFHQ